MKFVSYLAHFMSAYLVYMLMYIHIIYTCVYVSVYVNVYFFFVQTCELLLQLQIACLFMVSLKNTPFLKLNVLSLNTTLRMPRSFYVVRIIDFMFFFLSLLTVLLVYRQIIITNSKKKLFFTKQKFFSPQNDAWKISFDFSGIWINCARAHH